MSELSSQEKWLAEVKKQKVALPVSNHKFRLQIALMNVHQLDLQLVRWMSPLLLKHHQKIAEQMHGFATELYRMQNKSLSQETGEQLVKVYQKKTRCLSRGTLDACFLAASQNEARFFFKHRFSLSEQSAFLGKYNQAMTAMLNQEAGLPEQVLLLSKSLDKILRLMQQFVLDEYQLLEHEYETGKENALRFKAYHDALTGLPNDLIGEKTIEQLISARETTQKTFAVLKINVDRLKLINETFGRSIGNELLIALSGRMNQALDGFHAQLYRSSSDEFMIIYQDSLNQQELVQAAALLLRSTEKPYYIDGKEIYATFSIGIAEYPANGCSSVEILSAADAALREAKKNHKNRYFFYNNDLHHQMLLKVNTENELQVALYKHQFTLFYQPQVNADSGHLIGVEALIRWRHPKRGIILPGAFISVAEETGMICDIGWWVLNEACRQMKRWHDSGALNVPISVNLSFNQFHDDTLVKRVQRALKMSGLRPEFLELEITESTMAENLERSIKILNEIRALGVGVSLDDFGTGYSSLSYLKSLPINQLKIDRSFVRDIAQNHRDQAIVTAIVSMAEHLWIDVIVEGIESSEQLRAIQRCRCHAIQGNYYSQPLAEDDFSEKFFA